MTLDVATRAAHFPDRTAVIDHDTGDRWSYADIAGETVAAADRLAAAGVDASDRVVVLSRNRPELLALLFAARRRGATLAPVSHRLAEGTVAALVDRIDPQRILYEERFADLVPASEASRRLSAFLDAAGSAGEADAATPTRRDDDAEPLFLHTGGTTGTPKVVPISNRQIEWNCITEVAAWGLGKGTVAPILLPQFHTGGWNLLALPTLYVGGTVVLHREFDPGAALEVVETHGATHLFGVAAVFDAIAEHPAFETTDLSTVEWFMSGGGPTPEPIAAQYRDRGVPFVRGYGLTEGGPNNLYVDPDRDAEKPASVGRSFPDCRTRIVDDAGERVDRGDVGELELRGPVTAERYLATEDGTFAGEWVSTGDLVRKDEDGDHFITGRVDNMFVSGGENVHPETIESVLERHEAVEAAGVVGVSHERWGTVPKALVVAGGDAEPAAIEAFAAERLADYEQPQELRLVDALPRSGPGKLDREALRAQYGDRTDPDQHQ
ncbi:MAG: class I adenylate-forming enzyme family protein [Halolamina sp.]